MENNSQNMNQEWKKEQYKNVADEEFTNGKNS